MRRTIITMALFGAALTLSACGSKPPELGQQVVVERIPDSRPRWITQRLTRRRIRKTTSSTTLQPLPLHVPEVYRLHSRTVDAEGYVHLNRVRFSVPWQLIGRTLELRETLDRVDVYHGPRRVAHHRHLAGPPDTRVTEPAHRPPRGRRPAPEPSAEERDILTRVPALAAYLPAFKRHHRRSGAALRRLQRLLHTYPDAATRTALARAADYGLFDLDRIEAMILKTVADVGLIGYPSLGKSSLVAAMSAARPKVADYPFTTVEPHLGVVSPSGDDLRTLVMADIPGIIEGAHGGAGLGLQFLRHVERCPVLVHLVDLASDSPLGERVDTIRGELEAHTAPLEDRPWILVGTKLDAMADRETGLAELAATAKANGVRSTAISAVTGEVIDRLVGALFDLVEEVKEGP